VIDKERLDEIVDHLRGSCVMLYAELEEGEDEDQVQEYISQYIFECEGCGWWCEIDELHNETDRELCNDCWEHEDDEDD
jgi:hypothetical protein